MDWDCLDQGPRTGIGIELLKLNNDECRKGEPPAWSQSLIGRSEGELAFALVGFLCEPLERAARSSAWATLAWSLSV